MKILRNILCALSLCLPVFAQEPLNYDFNVILSGIFTPSFGFQKESSVEFNDFGGKFWMGKLTAPMPLDPKLQNIPTQYLGSHFLKFQTGPFVNGDCTILCTFGPGGHFFMESEEQIFIPCGVYNKDKTLNKACTFHGKFTYAQMSRQDAPNGTFVYTFSGWLHGFYFDLLQGQTIEVDAYYAQTSDNWKNLFLAQNAQQSWSGGVLTIFTGGPQG